MLFSFLQLGRLNNHHAFSKIFAAMNSKMVHGLCTCGEMDATNAAHQAQNPASWESCLMGCMTRCFVRFLTFEADWPVVGLLSFFFNTRSADWIEVTSLEGRKTSMCIYIYIYVRQLIDNTKQFDQSRLCSRFLVIWFPLCWGILKWRWSETTGVKAFFGAYSK